MANENLSDLERACYLSKENSRLYEAYYEEKKRVHDLMKENEKLKQRNGEPENGQRTSSDCRGKKKAVLEATSDKEEGEHQDTELVGALITNQRKTNDELMDIRNIVIDHLENLSTPTTIGVKRMGELDCKPFVEAIKRHSKDVQYEAMEKCSLWNKYIRDPQWYPFKVIEVAGKAMGVLDEEDEKLNGLKEEMGQEVYKAVMTALIELNEYNPSGGYVVPEIWHFKENRKASLKEALEFMLDGWTPKKRRRGRN